MEYGDRKHNQLGPELCAFYEKTWLTQASQKSMFDRFFTNTKTLPQKSTEEIIFRKYINAAELYFTGQNVNNTITGNDTAGGERTLVSAPKDAYKKFILPEGSSGDSKQSMKYVEVSATVFPIGDWMPETEEINLLHPVYTTTEAVRQMGDLGGTIINAYYRDQLSYGAGHVSDLSTVLASDGVFTTEVNKMYMLLMLSGAEPVSSILSSHVNYGTTPVDTSYLMVMHPILANEIRERNASFVPIEEYAAGVTKLDNEVGKLGMFRIVQDAAASITDAGAGEYVGDIFLMGKDHSSQVALRGKNRTEVIFQPMGSGGISDPLKRKGTLGWKTWLGAKTLYPERLGKITAKAGF